MTRIHQALAKMERERAMREAGRGKDEELPEPVNASPALPKPLSKQTFPEVSSSGAAVTLASPTLDADMLLADCARGEWQPRSSMLFFRKNEGSQGGEQFRTLRSRLYQMREQRPLRNLLVTSPLPNEGKSFVAANLAQAIACREGRRALLIDADLRNGRLHEFLGTGYAPGLSEYLLGETDEVKGMQRGQMENLVFLPAGRSVSNPVELIANGRFKKLLNRCEIVFDWVIIDSPPAIPVSDATLLADYCDGVLMVARAENTRADALRRAQQEFRPTQLVGAVLNGVPSTFLPYYGSYGRS